MDNFIYDIPTKVYFGENQLGHLGDELGRFGKRVLLVYGGGSIKKSGLYEQVVNEMKKSGLEIFELSGIAPNPRIDSVRQGVKLCKENKIDVLLAVGGGSTIDAAKFVAAGSCVDFDAWDFFSKSAPIKKTLPIVTILTLAATGSEMDDGGVISNPETREKIGLGADLADNRDYKGMIEAVGLGEKLHKYPSELSGGEQQRVSVARASDTFSVRM